MSKSSVLIFNGGSVGEGGSCNVHNLQLGVMTVNLPEFHTSSMYVLLDKSIPIESAPGYAPVDRYTLAEWIHRGDVIQVDCANLTSETDTSYAGALQSTTAVNQQGHVYTSTCTIRLDIKSNNHTESRYYRLEAVHDTLTDIWYLGQDVNEVTIIINEDASNKVQSLDNNSSHYPSCPAVKEAIDTAVASAYHAAGTKTVAQLTSALLVADNQGNVYNITDSGTTTADFVDGAGHPIVAGDNVGVCDVGGGVYKFDLLSGFVDLSGYKTKQTAVTDPTADGNGLTFIDSVSQNENGEIIPHKKTVQDARTTQKGVVQLDNVPTANSTNVPTSGGVYSAMKVGKLHRIGVRSVQAGDPSPKPQTDWIIDLESPNANEPDGYDRLTVSKAIELHENGEIFIFTNFGSATLDSSSCWFYESSVLASSNSITIKLLRSYVSNDVREVQGANLTSFGDYVGVLGWNGDKEFWRETFVTEGSNSLNHNKIHRLRPATDAVIGETSNYNGWVLDLESPNENAPGGYDRLTPQKLKQILDNCEFLVIETYTSGSYIPLALQALVDVQNQNPLRIRVDFVRQYVYSNCLCFEQMTIYTPSGEESYLQMLGIGPSSSWWLDKEALAINGDGSDVTASFTEAQTRTNISTGEKLSVLFGKIKKWFTDLATVAFSGSYNDLSNKPTIPAPQVQSDWNEADNTKADYIKNKPQLASVATSGSYNDLIDKPSIPAAQVQSDWSQSNNQAVDYIKNKPNLATVATSGSYDDLSNKPTTVNVNQVDRNTYTSSFTFVNGHIYHLTMHLQGSTMVIDSTASGTGYVVAYIGSSAILAPYSCRQSVDIQNGRITTDDIRLPIDWKAENISSVSGDNQLHIKVMFNNQSYTLTSLSVYNLTLMGTDTSGA